MLGFYLYILLIFLLLGGHDNGYAPTLTALENEQFLGKLVLLEGYEGVTSEMRKLALPSLKLEGVFMTQNLSFRPQNLTPLAIPGSKSVTTNGGLMSPRSPSSSSSSIGKKMIDPSLVRHLDSSGEPHTQPVCQPLHKQSPPPCNEFYLMSCFKGVSIYDRSYGLCVLF